MGAAALSVAAASAAERGDGRRAFAIEPQPLGQAIVQFSKAAGVDVIGDGGLVAGARSGRAVGVMTPEEALRLITKGTGASYRFTDPTTVALEAPEAVPMQQEASVPLQEITVEGEGGASGETATGPVRGFVARRSATATKTDTPLMETPRAVNVVTADEIAARGGAQNFNQALAYTPGFYASRTSDTRKNYDTYVRGFLNFESQYLDGFAMPTGYNRAQAQVEIYGLERLEILKGPASVLYGQSSPGGIVNMVSKRPTFEPIGEVQAQLGDPNRVQGAFDVSDKINGDDRFAYRVVGLAQKSDTHIDHVEDNRFFIAPSFTWKPNDDTSLTLLTHYRNNNGADAHGELPRKLIKDLPFGRYAGEPGRDDNKVEQYAIGYEFTRRINETFQFFSAARHFEANVNYYGTYVESVLKPGDEGYRSYGDVTRSAYLLNADLKATNADNRLQADFETGAFKHKVLVGLDARHDVDDEKSGYGFANAGIINLINPVYGRSTLSLSRNAKVYRQLDQLGVYAQDQIKFDRFILSLAGRHDWAWTKASFGPPAPATKDSALSGNAGLMYLFDNGFAPYASISKSFQPKADLAYGGKPFKPVTGQQYEAGFKYQPPGYNAMLTVSAFDLRQRNVPTRDVEHENCDIYDDCGFFNKQTGEIRVQGLEAEVKATLDALDLTVNYAYLDGRVTKSDEGNVGKRPENVPAHSGAFWANWRFAPGPLHGVNVGGGMRAIGGYFGDNDGKVRNEPVTLFDATLGYDFGARSQKLKGLRLDLNVINVADKKYYTCSEYGCHWAEARTALATMRYRW